jgi:uncharacterized membrane protein YdjX (TVP38/TMEM64 family)
VVRLPTLFASSRDRWQSLVLLVLLVGVALVVGSFLVARFPFLTDPQELRAILLGLGVFAPLGFIALQVVQVVVAPVPGQALGFASGYVFGALWGTVYSMVGIVAGTALAVGLARQFGRPYVERVVTADALAYFDETMGDHGLAVLFLVFLVPGLPDDAICFVAGLTDVPFRRIVAIAAVGRLPGFVLVNIAGSAAADGDPLVTAGLVGVLVSASVIGYLYHEQMLAAVLGRNPDQ